MRTLIFVVGAAVFAYLVALGVRKYIEMTATVDTKEIEK